MWAHAEDVVASGDPDRLVASFFAPASRRGALLTLYAFDDEVSRIALVTHEPMAGHIRLAWWREQIAAVYAGAVAVHAPLSKAIAEVVRAYGLPRDPFEQYLDARAFDLEEVSFEDEAALRAYAIGVGGGIVRLAARVLGAEHRADAAADHAGMAITYGRHLSELGLFVARRRCRLPAAWLHEAGLNAEDVFAARTGSAALQGVFDRMKGLVRTELAALNHAQYPRAATPALAVASLARATTRVTFDPLVPVAMPAWQRVARLSFANLTWRF